MIFPIELFRPLGLSIVTFLSPIPCYFLPRRIHWLSWYWKFLWGIPFCLVSELLVRKKKPSLTVIDWVISYITDWYVKHLIHFTEHAVHFGIPLQESTVWTWKGKDRELQHRQVRLTLALLTLEHEITDISQQRLKILVALGFSKNNCLLVSCLCCFVCWLFRQGHMGSPNFCPLQYIIFLFQKTNQYPTSNKKLGKWCIQITFKEVIFSWPLSKRIWLSQLMHMVLARIFLLFIIED